MRLLELFRERIEPRARLVDRHAGRSRPKV